MNTVFVGGSRNITKLNPKVTLSLKSMVDKGHTFLIGDAQGADKAVQNYLFAIGYENVIIYCMKNGCRNNLGNWKTITVDSPKGHTGFHYYSQKDLKMALDTDYGFMLWDSKSRGTLNNIINLVKENKTVIVYYSPTKSLYQVNSVPDLYGLLSNYDRSIIDTLLKDNQVSQLTLQI